MKLSLGNKFSLGIQLGSLIAQIFLKGHDADKAQAIGEKVAGVGETILDTVAPSTQKLEE